jgi:rubrerythrin
MTTKAVYAPPRSDYPNEGTGPHGRKYVPQTIEHAETLAPTGTLLWVCGHCDALVHETEQVCPECGAGRE